MGQASEPAPALVMAEPSERVCAAAVSAGSGGGVGAGKEDVPIRVQLASIRTVIQRLRETLNTTGTRV